MEILALLHVEKGDTLYISETPGGVRLSPYDATFVQKLDVFEQIMRENREVRKKLAE
jgi:hypothetical protein